MPIYPHRCPACGLEFDDLRPHSQSDDPAPCPRCRKSTPSPQAYDLKRVGVMRETSLDGRHPPITDAMAKTYRIHNRYYERPDIAKQISTGEIEYVAPKGMPQSLMPEPVKPKAGTAKE